VAHAIHYNSSCASGPYIIVNCAALPESLIESELFGHEKGAFTGATVFRKGRFELANNGTIFLDEIGDLPPAVQTKLLRVLQERVFERLGGNTSIKVNIRIIAATNRDLEALIREGKFREDLYYRLNIFPIVVPPLRERKTDIILLANHFIEKYAREMGKKILSISAPATDLLVNYHWPGNVRELENCIERAVILCTDGVIKTHHLPPNLQKSDDASVIESKGNLQDMLLSLERQMITDALKHCHGNMAKAARILGLTERIMGLRVVKFGIDPKQLR
jgi:Nif-specific regulatory protein